MRTLTAKLGFDKQGSAQKFTSSTGAGYMREGAIIPYAPPRWLYQILSRLRGFSFDTITTMSQQRLTREGLIEVIRDAESIGNRPSFVAISGFGGSGKSTLALAVAEALGEATTIVPIDDFIIGARDERSRDWRTFDRERLYREVITPARIGEVLRYQKYNSGDWVNGRGGNQVEITIGQTVLIEGCGILHPSLMDNYNCSAWIDLPQDRALSSAKHRDATEIELFGDDDTATLWDKVWGPNDADFFKTFRPDQNATVLVEPQF